MQPFLYTFTLRKAHTHAHILLFFLFLSISFSLLSCLMHNPFFFSSAQGLYVPPGKVVRIQTSDPTQGWSVRIGCHTDTLWHMKEWLRWPQISKGFNLGTGVTSLASPYGGLLYLEAGGGSASILVTVTGAARSPWFDALCMTEHDWSLSRTYLAPWAELGGKHVIISLPSASIRHIEHPKAVTDFWDSVVVCHASLKACDPPLRRERLVLDVQISAGYMHSGYPVGIYIYIYSERDIK